MSGYRVEPGAARQMDEIYDYSRRIWGPEQAERYALGLFESFQAIAERRLVSRTIPTQFGVEGRYSRYQQHFIYWKDRDDGRIGIFAVLHTRMSQEARLHFDEQP